MGLVTVEVTMPIQVIITGQSITFHITQKYVMYNLPAVAADTRCTAGVSLP